MKGLKVNVGVVAPWIANYPCIFAFRRDNLNVGMCLVSCGPDPSCND